jgi:uncharacterized membrane protein
MENYARDILTQQRQNNVLLEREIIKLENRVKELTDELSLLTAANSKQQEFIKNLRQNNTPEPEIIPAPEPIIMPETQSAHNIIQSIEFTPPPLPVQENEPPPPQPIQPPLPPAEPKPKFSWEKRIGLNVLNKIGILFVIFGAIATAAHPDLDRGLRGLLLFVLALSMVGFGEFLGRKKANVFSLGMVAGGVAVAYAAWVSCYFILHVISIYPAALLCIIITAGAFILSIRHNSQVIAAFSIIGGFLPLLTLTSGIYVMHFSAMAYFVILGGYALSLSFKRKWIVATFFALTMNLAAMFRIMFFFSSSSSGFHKALLILYISASFMTYVLIPVIGTYVEKLRFKKSDIVLIAINTFYSYIIIYISLGLLRLDDYYGLIPVAFMLCFIGLARFLRTRMVREHDMGMLFFITSVTFFALIIPMHFGVIWLTLGWLIQGVGLAVYGILKEKKRFSLSGFIINGLCLFSFVNFDLFNFSRREHFELKYLALTLGALIIITAYAYVKRNNECTRIIKYCGLVNLWFFLIYITGRMFDTFFTGINYFNRSYLYCTTVIAITFIIAYIAPKIKAITDKGVVSISQFMYVIGVIILLAQNGILNPIRASEPPVNVIILASLLLITINALSIFALSDMLGFFVKHGKMRVEWLPFLASVYFTIILTQNLTVYYNVPFAGMAISLIYGALAIMWCAFGFWKRFAFMRRFGLCTALMAVTKVFMVDLWSLTEGYRIITFFALGVVLMIISFAYQYFTKRIEG